MQFVMVLGRILFSLIFILAAVNKIMNWSASEQHLANSLLDLLSRTQELSWAQHFLDELIPRAGKLLALGVAAELIGGILIFFGIQPRLGALILFVFLIPTTFLFHSFWHVEGSMREMQVAMFLKNISIMGGCLILMAAGHKKSKASKKNG